MTKPGGVIPLGESGTHVANLLRQFERNPDATLRLVRRIREFAAKQKGTAAADLLRCCDYILEDGKLVPHSRDWLLLAIGKLDPTLVLGAEVRRGRVKGGERTAKKSRTDADKRTDKILKEFARLSSAGRAKREIAAVIAAKLNIHPSTVRRHLREKKRARA